MDTLYHALLYHAENVQILRVNDSCSHPSSGLGTLKIMQTIVSAKHTPSTPTPQRPSAKTQGRTNGPIEKGQLYIDTWGAPGAEGDSRKGHTFHQWLAYGLPPSPLHQKEVFFTLPSRKGRISLLSTSP